MRYYAARKKSSDGKWHYTVLHAGTLSPAGACANGCPGHATAQEAYGHERERRLSQVQVVEDSADPKTLNRCEAPGCKEYTSGGLHIPGTNFYNWWLCKEHRTVEHIASKVEVGDSWES